MSRDRWLHEDVLDSPGRLRPCLDLLCAVTSRDRVPTLARRKPVRPLTRRPTVSVVVPCYNYGRFLEAAVGSVLSQVDVDVDVVVVNDFSTDDSSQVAERLQSRDARVRVVHNAENLGHVRAFNRGLALATGEYVVRLDADDLLAPGALARAAGLLEAFPTVGLVYGHPRHFSSVEPPAPYLGEPRWTVWRGQDWLAERCRRGVNAITTPEAVLRREVIDQVGGLDTRLHFAQDMEMWLRVASVSDVGHVDRVDQALHRDHPASMSVTHGAGHLLDLQERRRVFDVLFDGPAGRLPGAAKMRCAAQRALAREALSECVRSYDRRRFDPDHVRALTVFALSVWPGSPGLREWARLLQRQRVGPAKAGRSLRSLVQVVTNRTKDEMGYLRWTRSGL